jgi:hypothetical protein
LQNCKIAYSYLDFTWIASLAYLFIHISSNKQVMLIRLLWLSIVPISRSLHFHFKLPIGFYYSLIRDILYSQIFTIFLCVYIIEVYIIIIITFLPLNLPCHNVPKIGLVHSNLIKNIEIIKLNIFYSYLNSKSHLHV